MLTVRDRMIDIAEAMAENTRGLGKLDAAYKAAEGVQKLAQSFEVPVYLVKETHDPSLIPHMSEIALSNDNTYGNPRIPTQEQLEELYRQAYRLSQPSTVAPFEYIAVPLSAIWGKMFWNDLHYFLCTEKYFLDKNLHHFIN